MFLSWHKHHYFQYEKELAAREVEGFFPGVQYSIKSGGIEIDIPESQDAIAKLSRLVYFSSFQHEQNQEQTLQAKLECSENSGAKRQSTRYSAHGIHEYKGKFNPQIVRAILNIYSIDSTKFLLDPFCGSGTTLLECSHLGVHSMGVDINPLAVFIANVKQQVLGIEAIILRNLLREIEDEFSHFCYPLRQKSTPRLKYLKSWFSDDILADIESLKFVIKAKTPKTSNFFLAIASNLLREYSLQDPGDLRIRRRKSPLPTISFFLRFKDMAEDAIKSIEKTQKIIGINEPKGVAYCADCKEFAPNYKGFFDFVLTSPPYATALPYIDTQRLSLVWLDMIPPDQIIPLDMKLIGSREVKTKQLQEAKKIFVENSRGLVSQEFTYCNDLAHALSVKDGFRRKAVPYLLYRYFSDMQDVFINVRKLV